MGHKRAHLCTMAMHFWGDSVKPNTQGVELGEFDEDAGTVLHLSQAAISKAGKAGDRTQLKVTVQNESYVLATLESGRCDQVSFDLFFSPSQAPTFTVVGGSTVDLTGYFCLTAGVDFDDLDEDEDEDEDEDTSDKDAALKENTAKNA